MQKVINCKKTAPLKHSVNINDNLKDQKRIFFDSCRNERSERALRCNKIRYGVSSR